VNHGTPRTAKAFRTFHRSQLTGNPQQQQRDSGGELADFSSGGRSDKLRRKNNGFDVVP